jgi:DNA polymerase elongation subunit (family B)
MKLRQIVKIEEIENTEDYIIYIDTDSCYFSSKQIIDAAGITTYKNKKQVTIELCKEFEFRINEFYDIMCPRLFNTNEHCIRIASDVIAVRAVWLAKKAYAMLKVYDMELSKDLDTTKDGGKLDVKGLGTVRSSFPEIFRTFMSEILIKILTDISEKELSARINEFERQIINTSLDEIAKSSSVKEIDKWMKVKKRLPFGELAKHKNKVGKNLGCPAHVKSAIHYNDFLEYFKLTDKFERIRDGEKAKWVYLKMNPFRLDGLSFKGFDDPPEILEYIQKYADKPRIFESEMKKKLENFYKALKWKYPTGNEEIVNQFFDF